MKCSKLWRIKHACNITNKEKEARKPSEKSAFAQSKPVTLKKLKINIV
jgi:hypothetical protein